MMSWWLYDVLKLCCVFMTHSYSKTDTFYDVLMTVWCPEAVLCFSDRRQPSWQLFWQHGLRLLNRILSTRSWALLRTLSGPTSVWRRRSTCTGGKSRSLLTDQSRQCRYMTHVPVVWSVSGFQFPYSTVQWRWLSLRLGTSKTRILSWWELNIRELNRAANSVQRCS